MTETQNPHVHTDDYRRGNRSPEAIEHEIDAERRSVSDTIDALQEKMSVGGLADEAWRKYRHHGIDAGRALGRSAAQNPLPLMLTGIGLAWLMVSSRSRHGNSDDYGSDSHDPNLPAISDGRKARPYSDAVVGGSSRQSDGPSKSSRAIGAMGSAWGGARSAVGSTAHRAGDAGHSAYDSARGAAGSASRAAESAADSAADSARRAAGAMGGAARRAGNVVDDYPLAMGALALAAGAVIGSALSRSRIEDEYLGRYSDDAWHMAENEIEKTRRVAGAVSDEARRIADEKSDEVSHEVSEEARTLSERVKSETREAADRLSDKAKDESQKQELGNPDKRA